MNQNTPTMKLGCNLNVRAAGVKLLIRDSFDRSNALREANFVKKVGTVKPTLLNPKIPEGPAANSSTDYLLLKILSAA